jgi:DNA-binding transcriptional MocR family regulator
MADPIPFTRGVPSADMLPVDDMRAALAAAMEREPVVALSYSPGGHKGLRAWIGARHGAPVERVICANGSLEAFAFVASVLLARASTTRVLVEAPTYDRSIRAPTWSASPSTATASIRTRSRPSSSGDRPRSST